MSATAIEGLERELGEILEAHKKGEQTSRWSDMAGIYG